ncbi:MULTISPECIES: hypothetical protein [unclassified Rhodococcus (in: high G+C Gram-positive bacteria)]|jgi:ribosomal protein S17E|uniref:hypothetical protein n=1 Tax=unclassified Rhodococcus (in: high G+C Gram-positive bacteria) TaxID=192944 RepID=UPI00146B0C8D|nr:MULTISPECIES: hypothetical protein [unclassified Rhodococcus (in: high G+C Gram-positive bacteria)]MBF0663220.1 hypothetical protein [Rhodococcus sp. (in: high G+C Gram-positive bacteria)]NMD95130.1 hypothetical protein [Rhodococcus sp. BL-253-APC-6A1W]NME81230.1 hypothetical protein [Rhodococcus sp. 105337]
MVGKFERNKDTIQEMTESAATRVGAIAGIITGAVRDVTREVGGWITDGIEMREAARKARSDEERGAAEGGPTVSTTE